MGIMDINYLYKAKPCLPIGRGSESMELFQKLPLQCPCCQGQGNCLCGDCSGCLRHGTSSKNSLGNVRRALILCGAIIAIGFTLFAPVVSVNTDIPVGGGISVTTVVQTNTASTIGFGSISFCYFGEGALLIQGAYYPLTKSTVEVVGAYCPALQVRH